MVYIENDSEAEWLASALHINESHPIDHVYTLEDDLQLIALTLCESLGISYCYSRETLEVLSNKFMMREKLSRCAFDNIKYMDNLTTDKILEFVSNEGVSILKPKNGSASQDVYQITKSNFEALTQTLENLPLENFVIEQFLEGEEFSVESYSENGTHQIYCITEKIKNEDFIELGHIVPATLTDTTIEVIQEYVNQFLNLMHMTDGPCHTEVILTNQGPKIVESQARFGGDHINDLYHLSFGQDIISMIFKGLIWKNQIGHIGAFHTKVKQFAAIAYLPPSKGWVEKINVKDVLLNKYHIQAYRIWCKEKSVLKQNQSSTGRIAHAISVGKSRQDAIFQAQQFLNEGIEIKIQTCEK